MTDYLRVSNMEATVNPTTYSPAVENTTAQTGNLSGIVFSAGQSLNRREALSELDLSPILHQIGDSANTTPRAVVVGIASALVSP